MLKFLVLGVIMSRAVVKTCYGQTQPDPYDVRPEILKGPISPPKNYSNDVLILPKDGQYHIYASRLNLYSGGGKNPTDFTNNLVGRRLDADYVATERIGAHKLHVREVTWDKARRTCVEEGGHLAIIRTDLEEKIILSMMANKSTHLVWVGYHDMFKKGDWLSVLDEPLAETGWGRWSAKFSPNPRPDSGNCAELEVQEEVGLVNINCDQKRAFVCKVSID